MSFYSYKNAGTTCCPGTMTGNVSQGLNERICVQVKNVYDACLQQEQLDEVDVLVKDIVPVLPDPCNCRRMNTPCRCKCKGNSCQCTCGQCGKITYQDAYESAENSECPLPVPFGQWTFESCRSSTTAGTIRDLAVERLCDRPQFARVKGTIDIPIDVLFTDQRCQEWMGRATVSVVKDVLLCIPDESIVPFKLESMVSAICVNGVYLGDCVFEITICVTVVLKVLAEVEVMIPTFGFCEIPPCEEFAENVCDEFFSLPLFPQQQCRRDNGTNTSPVFNCAPTNNGTGGVMGACMGGSCARATSSCSQCGTSCGGCCSSCPRCGCAMTPNS
ncbi:hypothetical protein ACH6CV_12340 [Bacillota bacterium Meth-B3]